MERAEVAALFAKDPADIAEAHALASVNLLLDAIKALFDGDTDIAEAERELASLWAAAEKTRGAYLQAIDQSRGARRRDDSPLFAAWGQLAGHARELDKFCGELIRRAEAKRELVASL